MKKAYGTPHTPDDQLRYEHRDTPRLSAPELKDRLKIDLVLFELLEVLEIATDVHVLDDDLEEVGLPTVTALTEAAAEALEQEPETALRSLRDLMVGLNFCAGFYGREVWIDEAQWLKDCWYEIDELLKATCPDLQREPWVDTPVAFPSRQIKAAA